MPCKQSVLTHRTVLEAVKIAAQCSSVALGRVLASRRLGYGLRIFDCLLVVLHLADGLGREDEGLGGALDCIAFRAILVGVARGKGEFVDGLPGSTAERSSQYTASVVPKIE